MGLSMVSDQPHRLTFSWMDRAGFVDPSQSDANLYHDDRVFVLLYNHTEDVYTTNSSAIRSDEGLNFDLPALFAGHELHAWVFVQHRDGEDVSTSQYAGTLTLAGEGNGTEPDENTEEVPEP